MVRDTQRFLPLFAESVSFAARVREHILPAAKRSGSAANGTDGGRKERETHKKNGPIETGGAYNFYRHARLILTARILHQNCQDLKTRKLAGIAIFDSLIP